MHRRWIYQLYLTRGRALGLLTGLSALGLLAFLAGFVLGVGKRPAGEAAAGIDVASLCRQHLAEICPQPGSLLANGGPSGMPAEADAVALAPLPEGEDGWPSGAEGEPAGLPEEEGTELAWQRDEGGDDGEDEGDPDELAALLAIPVADETGSRPSPTPARRPEPSRAGAHLFSVQVGAFREPANADRLLAQLEARAYSPYLLVRRDPQGRTWHVVRLADFADEGEARAAAQRFQQEEKLEAFVRPRDLS